MSKTKKKKMASKNEPKKVFDVAKPGKSAASPTSRPVIVNHGPMILDPTVIKKVDDPVNPEVEPVENKPTESKIKVGEKVVTPPSEVITTDQPKEELQPENTIAEAPTNEPKVESPEVKQEYAADVKPEVKPAETPAEAEVKSEAKPEADTTEAAVVDAVAEQAEQNKKTKPELTEEEKAKQEHIQKLIDTKQFYVPVGQVQRRRNNRDLIILILFLICAAIAAYVLIDAGFINVGIKVPFDLIKN